MIAAASAFPLQQSHAVNDVVLHNFGEAELTRWCTCGYEVFEQPVFQQLTWRH